MINCIEARESGHLFEESLWFHQPDGNLVQGILVADSLNSATILVLNETCKARIPGRLQYFKGKERGQATRVLQFIPENGSPVVVVQVDVLSAPNQSGT